MATREPQVTALNDDAVRVSWSAIAQGDACGATTGISEYDDRSIQVSGTFGGATISLHGSNEGESGNYVVLSDPGGNALDITTARLRAVLEYAHSLKPILTGGDGTTSLTVTLVAKRKRK